MDITETFSFKMFSMAILSSSLLTASLKINNSDKSSRVLTADLASGFIFNIACELGPRLPDAYCATDISVRLSR